jgi:transposase InsO family protein
MTTEIKRRAEACSVCRQFTEDQQKEPLMPHPTPTRPWQKVGVDVFTFERTDYLLTTDYLSGFFEVERLPSKTVADITYCLRQHFARHGIPEVVMTDNSPFNSADFRKFAKQYEFTHKTSSPRYPQSNGKAENSIKTIKRLMIKARQDGSDPLLALLDWRNTPSEQLGVSPTQILFGRRSRTLLPCSDKLLQTPYSSQARIALERAKDKQAVYYNRHAKRRPSMTVGQTVRYKHNSDPGGWRKGQIVEQLQHRSYNIRAEDGSVYRRTSKHIRPSAESPLVVCDDDGDDDLVETDLPTAPAAQSTTLNVTPAARLSERTDHQTVLTTRSGRV